MRKDKNELETSIDITDMDSQKQTQIQRIMRMENIYDQSCTVVNDLLHAIQAYIDIEPKIMELSQYYQSALWLADFDDDRDGNIPTDLKRGILTEDAIYDLLTDQYRMIQTLQEIVVRNLKQYHQEEA